MCHMEPLTATHGVKRRVAEGWRLVDIGLVIILRVFGGFGLKVGLRRDKSLDFIHADCYVRVAYHSD